MSRSARARHRSGFTIVELLVSFALILFIMTILSEAFGAAAKTFHDLKAIGDLCSKLRFATNMMRRDLAADHFDGRRRLSDPNFWANGPPIEGYFRIYQDTDPVAEGNDLDNVWSYQSAHQIVQFTSKLHGNTRDDYYVGTVSQSTPKPLAPSSPGADTRYEDLTLAGNLYQYRFTWAELAYFLRPQVNPISSVQDTANGQPLYTLYRRQWLPTPDFSSLSSPVPIAQHSSYLEVSCMTDPNPTDASNLYFNSPVDLTLPPRRMGTKTTTAVAPYVAYSPSALFSSASTTLSVPTITEDVTSTGSTSPLGGSDMLLSDVLSFEVRVLLKGGTEFVSLRDSTVQAFASNNVNYNVNATGYNASTSVTTNKFLFDTWSSMTDNVYDFSNWSTDSTGVNSIPLYQDTSGNLISIRAIQLTIRIWDYRTEQTRQVTVVQDL
jgi:type II secretory pathway pseudopilin PulG